MAERLAAAGHQVTTAVAATGLRPQPGRWQRVRRFVRRWPVGVISALVLLLLILIALLAPQLAPYGPNQLMAGERLSPPSSANIMGTDNFGRDVFSQILYGARVSITVGLLSTVFGSVVGVAIGLIGGYRGGWIDTTLQRIMDVLMTFPTLILAMVVIAVLGPSRLNLIIAVGLPVVPRISRVVRSRVLLVTELPFVEAATVIGNSGFRTAVRHVLPNCVSIITVLATGFLGRAIIAEASLNFLGLGMPPDVPTWGAMLGEATAPYFEQSPWMAVWPGLAIALTVLSCNLLGDTVRDILDPRTRKL